MPVPPMNLFDDYKLGGTQVSSLWLNGVKVWPPDTTGAWRADVDETQSFIGGVNTPVVWLPSTEAVFGYDPGGIDLVIDDTWVFVPAGVVVDQISVLFGLVPQPNNYTVTLEAADSTLTPFMIFTQDSGGPNALAGALVGPVVQPNVMGVMPFTAPAGGAYLRVLIETDVTTTPGDNPVNSETGRFVFSWSSAP